MSDQSGMSAMTEKGALDLAIATLQQRVKERDGEISRLRSINAYMLASMERASAMLPANAACGVLRATIAKARGDIKEKQQPEPST